MTKKKHSSSSNYINEQRKEYSLYVLMQRALLHASDGLIPAARRILWTAKDGKKYKCATLAGATMPIHPHASPEDTVRNLAAPYSNNILYLDGHGAFGTLLKPGAYGAARYTSVSTSAFTKDVMFRDLEIIPTQDNYDGTLREPVHFLPLVPTVLLNPQSGIAVGFAANILPRDLQTIIKDQIAILTEQATKIKEPAPIILPLTQTATGNGDSKWIFTGSFERVNTMTVKITNLPYGKIHEKYMEKLLSILEDKNLVNNVETDVVDNSKDYYDITVKFKRGVLTGKSDDDIINLLQLTMSATENFNIIDFTGNKVWSPTYAEFISAFTEWRLGWYVPRYERLKELLEIDTQRYKDILLAIRKNVGSMVKKIRSKAELKTYLEEIGIVHIDYIADLPIYRFTEEEKAKIEDKLKEANKTLKEYNRLLRSKDARKEIYISELKEVAANYKKGIYTK